MHQVYFYCWVLLYIISGTQSPLSVTWWLFYALYSCNYFTLFSSFKVLEVYDHGANKHIELQTVKLQASESEAANLKITLLSTSQKNHLSSKLHEFTLHNKFWSFTDCVWITDFIPH